MTDDVSVKVKCPVGGEEEIGSPNLSAFVANYEELVMADAGVV